MQRSFITNDADFSKGVNEPVKSLVFAICMLLVLTHSASAGELTVEWEMIRLTNRLSVEASLPILERAQVDLGIAAFGRMQDLDAFGTEVWKAGLHYDVTDHLEVFVGRLDTTVGRARRSSLLLNPGQNTFLQAGYSFGGSQWNYTKLHGDLAVAEDYKRLGLHYLDWQVLPQLAFGVGEAVVTDSSFPGDFIFDRGPFVPYYAAKYMPGVSSVPNNALVMVDAQYTWEDLAFYGEFLVNEFPMVPDAGNPPLWGLVVGVEGPWWLVEYSRVGNYAYSNGNLDTTYSLDQASIGHPLGDDVQELWLEVRGSLNQWDIQWKGGAFFRGFGAEDDGSRQLIKWDRTRMAEQPFMAGIPEYHYGLHADAAVAMPQGFELGANIEVAYVTQFEHREDTTGVAYRAALRAVIPLF